MISGIHTDFVVSEFSDRWFIILSQFENLGTLVGIVFLVAYYSSNFSSILGKI